MFSPEQMNSRAFRFLAEGFQSVVRLFSTSHRTYGASLSRSFLQTRELTARRVRRARQPQELLPPPQNFPPAKAEYCPDQNVRYGYQQS